MIFELSELIRSSIQQSLEDRVAISFSGGVDSTIISSLARQHSEVELFCAGVEGSPDLEYAEKAANQFTLPLHKTIINEEKAMEIYDKCYRMLPMNLLKVEILVPVYLIAEAASRKNHSVLLFGSGAEELFAGYDRYYAYKEEGKNVDEILREEFRTLPQREIAWVKKVCRKFGIEARFPYYNRKLADFVFTVPVEDRMEDRELKKVILREAGKLLGAPEIALQRRKKAMQYGSGVHKIFMKRADELNAAYPSS